jgi:hypothetical protein
MNWTNTLPAQPGMYLYREHDKVGLLDVHHYSDPQQGVTEGLYAVTASPFTLSASPVYSIGSLSGQWCCVSELLTRSEAVQASTGNPGLGRLFIDQARDAVDKVAVQQQWHRLVTYEDCRRLLGDARFDRLVVGHDPKIGPREGVVFAWKVIGWLTQ